MLDRLNRDAAPEVLLLEDDPPIAHITAQFLARSGWLPVIAQTVTEGQRYLSRPNLLAAVLDVQVGDGDGVVFFGEMPVQLQTRTVFVTGDTHSAFRAGQTGRPVLLKPYPLAALQAHLDTLYSGIQIPT